LPDGHTLLVIGEIPDVTATIVAALTSEGYRIRRLLPGKLVRQLETDCYEADFSCPHSIRAAHQRLTEPDGSLVGGAINFLGLCPAFRQADGEEAEATLKATEWTFNLVKEFAEDLRASSSAGGGWFVNLTGLGGQFGLDGDVPSLTGSGTLGIAKTLKRENPRLRVKNVDVDPRLTADALAARLLQELAIEDNLLEVGLTARGHWQPTVKRDPTPSDLSSVALDRDSMIVLTGGARGVTADVAREFAGRFKSRLILVGRSSLPPAESTRTRGCEKLDLRKLFLDEARAAGKRIVPAEIERSVQHLLQDRQIRATIDVCTAAGARVEYHALDVRDGERFGQWIDHLYDRFGRIDGVIHGAGIIEDKRIADKTLESFANVFRTKVEGAFTLARKLRPETLKFLVFFGSVSGRFGNVGQVDYSAANEVLNKLADRLNRQWPGKVTCINWGPWDGGMVSDELRRLYATAGVEVMPVVEGVAALLSEIAVPNRASAEVVVGRGVERLLAKEISERKNRAAEPIEGVLCS
jgi:NAD(P)-dependent dehydrogenase (short-subunit alcohol dehydrogenase family)